MRRSIMLSALIALTTGAAAQQPSPIPEKFTNLKILPKDITRQQLVPIMRSFAMHLGVRCEHCHVGEGNDLSKFDFAADERPAKAIARKMMTMAAALNEQLASIGEPAAAGTSKVNCYTCHRGAKRPLTAPPVAGRGGPGTPDGVLDAPR